MLNESPNWMPSEILKYKNYQFRSDYFRIMDLYKIGGHILSKHIYERDGKLLTSENTEYSFQSITSLTALKVKSNSSYYSQLFAAASEEVEFKTNLKDQYYGTDFQSVGRLYGINNLFVYSKFSNTIGYFVPVRVISISNDQKSSGNMGYQTTTTTVLISGTGNRRLDGKPRKIHVLKKGFTIPNKLLPTEEETLFRYPSDFLTPQKRGVLDQDVFQNDSYFSSSGLDRHTMALSILAHGVQDESPIEKYTYFKKPGSQSWRLAEVGLNLPYAWGDMHRPLISKRYSHVFPITSLVTKAVGSDFPAGFTPIDWDSQTKTFVLDNGYEIVSEIFETGPEGQTLTSATKVKRPNGSYLNGEFQSQILGYGRTIPIASIALAKGSECAYTSFEMPIVNHSDENWWGVYDFPKQGETVNYTDIVNEGFTGGRSARVNYSFGPTFSLPLNPQAPLKDYVFEAWVKKDGTSADPATGRLIAYVSGQNAVLIYAPTLENNTFSAGDEWKHIKIRVPISNYSPTGDGPFFLRLYPESDKSSMQVPSMQGFLVDEIRVYPVDAIMKSFSVDLETGNSFMVDVKGKRVQKLFKNGRQLDIDPWGSLKSLGVFNISK